MSAVSDLAVYCHIPFCERRCHYCAFPRVAGQAARHDAYMDALRRDISATLPSLPYTAMTSMYIGGGTPSVIAPARLAASVTDIASLLPPSVQSEISVECNPHSLSSEFIDELTGAGVNRFSLGVQSCADAELAWLGRLHDAAGAAAAFSLLRRHGCRNVSVDLMCGIPGQTDASWRATLHRVAEEWRPEHISFYLLSLEPGTRFVEWRNDPPDGFDLPDDDTVMNRYWDGVDTLARAGYGQYEISNFALPGFEARHNQAYWDTTKHYIGVGAASHSFCRRARGGEPRRFRVIKDIGIYIARVAAGERYHAFSRRLTPREREGERILLGLRRRAGVRLTARSRAFFADTIDRHASRGLLAASSHTIALTRRGMELANTVMADFAA